MAGKNKGGRPRLYNTEEERRQRHAEVERSSLRRRQRAAAGSSAVEAQFIALTPKPFRTKSKSPPTSSRTPVQRPAETQATYWYATDTHVQAQPGTPYQPSRGDDDTVFQTSYPIGIWNREPQSRSPVDSAASSSDREAQRSLETSPARTNEDLDEYHVKEVADVLQHICLGHESSAAVPLVADPSPLLTAHSSPPSLSFNMPGSDTGRSTPSPASFDFASSPLPHTPNHMLSSPPPVVGELTPARLRDAAVQAILCCLQHHCQCNTIQQQDGLPLSQMATLLGRQIPLACADSPDAPFSMSASLALLPPTKEHLPWEALLTGHTLDPNQTLAGPPTLNFHASEAVYKQSQPSDITASEFDIDSVLFLAHTPAVFQNPVEWCFRPAFVRTQQPNQRIDFPGADIQKDKCLLLCLHGRWECFVFFPNMPNEYTSHTEHTVKSRSQHLDDYALKIWTDSIVLKAMDHVFPRGMRHHFPSSFEEIRYKSSAKSEVLLDGEMHNSADIRIPVPSELLGPLWTRVLEHAEEIPGTLLPSNAFHNPVLLVQNHNMKLTTKNPQFSTVRAKFLADMQSMWNEEHLAKEHFWVDLGFERFPENGPTTLLRKRTCSEWWATQLDSPALGQEASSVRTTWYPWANTSAGSVTVELLESNTLRHGGLAYCKAYNVIKEQFATPFKGLVPFQEPLLEVLAYSQELMQSWADAGPKNQWALKLNRQQTLRRLQRSKERVYQSLHHSRAASYGDRQEFRISFETLEAMPEDTGPFCQQATPQPEDSTTPAPHHSFWFLSTHEVNSFRIAESNRWLLALETAARMANYAPSADQSTTVTEQEHNSLLSTASARLLRFSLGCLNPREYPSLWEGKRWVKSRYDNTFRNALLSVEPVFQRRQGLDLGRSIQKHNMAWLPHKLAHWGNPVPVFKIDRYPHLDIATNSLRATLNVTASVMKAKIQTGHVRDYTRIRMKELTRQFEVTDRSIKRFVDVLVQMCVQEYNIWVWAIIKKRWTKQRGKRSTSDSLFSSEAALSDGAKTGMEILSFARLDEYIGEEGLGVEMFEIAYTKRKSRSNHFPTWHSGLWVDRVAPLFRRSAEQPVWGRTAPHSLKVDEVHAMIREQVESPEYARQMGNAFDDRIKSTAGFYVQAILHYEHDKGSTLAKASPLNATTTKERRCAQSDLERTKWMFPRFADGAVDQDGLRGQPLSVGKARMLSRKWETLKESDVHTEFSYPPKRLVRGTHTFSEHSGRLDTLEHFNAEQRTWTAAEQARVHGQDAGEETDWPERPTRDARATANDDSGLDITNGDYHNEA